MPVVSNTSPILNLAIVDRLKLLHQQFGQIQIPAVVLEELKVGEERPGSQSIQAAIADGWIQVQGVGNQTFVQLLRQTLDGGEAEAIAPHHPRNAIATACFSLDPDLRPTGAFARLSPLGELLRLEFAFSRMHKRTHYN